MKQVPDKGLAKGHLIAHVADGSIGSELGLKPGDHVLSLDGRQITDIFDFHIWQLREKLILSVITAEHELIEFEIEKDADEGLGLSFESDMLGDCRTCHNKCVFCFIDQMPPNMRESLYLKDDDLRMSFLNGNYVTLTNMKDEELDRLIDYRLSPINVSVHTTDPKLRRLMMAHKQAGEIMNRLIRIASAGITINAQIVLCPDLNDDLALEKTLTDLADLGDALGSVAVVPVGLTRFRTKNRLYPLRPVTREDAVNTLDIIERWQQKLLLTKGRRTVFASDEFYLQAERSLPGYEAYEDFPQLENGIGMTAMTMRNLDDALQTLKRALSEDSIQQTDTDQISSEQVILATGTAFKPVLKRFAEQLSKLTSVGIHVLGVENRFFGTTINVAGLITGQDLVHDVHAWLAARPELNARDCTLIIPENMLRADTQMMLDDMTLDEISQALQVKLAVCHVDGSNLLDIIINLDRTLPYADDTSQSNWPAKRGDNQNE